MGVTAAFIFAAQMFNFQVIGGTSGHLLGGVFAAVLLGPWAGTLVDGLGDRGAGTGLPGWWAAGDGRQHLQHGDRRDAGGYYVYRRVARSRWRSAATDPAAGVAAWLSVVAGATCMSLELAISGASPLDIVLPAMVGVHVFIGVGEALITMAALAFIQVARPDLFTIRDGMTGEPSGSPTPAMA